MVRPDDSVHAYSLSGAFGVRRFATGHDKGVVRVWDASTRGKVFIVSEFETPIDSFIDSLAMSSDGEKVYVTDYYNGLFCSRDSIVTSIGQFRNLQGVICDPFDQSVWIWSDSRIKNLDSTNYNIVKELSGYRAAVSSNRKRIAHARGRKPASIYVLDEHHNRVSISNTLSFGVLSICVCNQGCAALLPGGDLLWIPPSGTKPQLLAADRLPDAASHCAFTPDETEIVLSASSNNNPTTLFKLPVANLDAKPVILAVHKGRACPMDRGSAWVFDDGTVFDIV